MPLLPQPPSIFTGAVRSYMALIAAAINQVPEFSYFTQQTPNGVVRGNTGDFAVYIGSASTVTHLWVKSSDATTGTPSLQSWRVIA